MTATDWAAIGAASVTILINLLTAAYVYGKLTQRVSEHDRRLNKLEEWKEEFS